ncbi:MAG TPA: hypothetical protein VFZ59_08600 [Verrucomicrobiae bacterium]|nr:hypothetical protein [Verrucomicrobiae bacterium]
MKSILKLVVQWDTLKMKEPAGNTHAERFAFLKFQEALLSELSDAGCVQIPGEPLPVSEMIAERRRLLARWDYSTPNCFQKVDPHIVGNGRSAAHLNNRQHT